MKKGNPLFTHQRHYRDKIARAKKMAPTLLANKIKKINATRYKIYNNIFFLHEYTAFKLKYHFPRRSLALLMVIDFYTYFVVKDVLMWGLYPEVRSVYKDLNHLKENGWVYREGSRYLITLMGQKLLEEFEKEYFTNITRLNKKNYERAAKDRVTFGFTPIKIKKRPRQNNISESASDGTDSNGGDTGYTY